MPQKRVRCTNANCQSGKVPCPHGYLNGHNQGTQQNPDMCYGSTCGTCSGTGFVTINS